MSLNNSSQVVKLIGEALILVYSGIVRTSSDVHDEQTAISSSEAGKESLENVRFQIKPNKIGKNSYLIKCSALSDEINIQNNQQKIIMHVMKDRYNVAIITYIL